MLLLCFLMNPHLIVFAVRETIRYRLNIYEKGILEFFSFMSIILTYANSFANAVLFLLTNVKARRILQNFLSVTEKLSKNKKTKKQVFLEFFSYKM